jgi:hypothetical protein
MKIGDMIESAMWITGDEPQTLRRQYERDVNNAITSLCEENGLEHGPVKFIEKHPSDDRVPDVPEHVQGSRVRLLVAETEIVGKRPLSSAGSFVANLEKKDLNRLRAITRRKWAERHWIVLTDEQCDECIEELGPEAALDTLRSLH